MTAPAQTLLGWLAPLALVGVAIGAHWIINVPAGPLPPPIPKEEPKKPADKSNPKTEGDDDRDKDDEPVDEPFTSPRSASLLAQLFERHDKGAWKSEPVFEAWNTAHRPIINQLVAAARHRTFAGVSPPPSISVSGVECKTVRCRFTLASAAAEDLEKLTATLQGLKLEGGPLWHLFKPDAIAEEPAKRPGAAVRQKTTITVAFARDLPPIDQMTLADGTPLRPPVAPVVPAGPADAPLAPTGTAPRGAPTGPLSTAPGSTARPSKG